MMKIKLTEVTINKYKSFQQAQTIKIEDDITVLVGMNEAGKTVLLEAMAKLNYFDKNDSKFHFDINQDYPRKELVKFQKSDEDITVVNCKYHIEKEFLSQLDTELLKNVIKGDQIEYSYRYKKKKAFVVLPKIDRKFFLKNLYSLFNLSIEALNTLEQFGALDKIVGIDENNFPEDDLDQLKELQEKCKEIIDTTAWEDKIQGYIWSEHLLPALPKFWYFDDYYQLDGRVKLKDLKDGIIDDEKSKTAYALLELAGVDLDELLQADDYEAYIAQLEAASNEITEQIFNYWKSNPNLDIEFKIEKNQKEIEREVTLKNPSYPHNTHKEIVKDIVTDPILDIRVKSQQHKITLPLHRRSKGFNWFFSFVTWFSKIQADKTSNYVLLFDEPGLNLHALAQSHLLSFIEDLSKNYQIIYSTHSPFMIESTRLNRVRTIVEKQEGSIVSETIMEKDPNTLFPLQAALGYDLAQNLFIGKKNLLVEGPADLLFFITISELLKRLGRTGLKPDITIVPVGGLDKVSTFISLLRGSQLQIVCMLDSFNDAKGKQKVVDLVKQKVIREKQILFFDQFVENGGTNADIEDLFDKEDYLKLFNIAFGKEYGLVKVKDLNSDVKRIVLQINQIIKKERFNHYLPAYALAQNKNLDEKYFSEKTLKNFENCIQAINTLLK